MSAALKQRFMNEAATQELWRVAETNNVDELTRVLPRVIDVNASNRHGMTALMRASYHGHSEMVRALLKHGADPNLLRNDRFTALALAAFFGHTETVRILIEHGARTEVVTRCGASAQTWATVRTFAEAARCLKSHARGPVPIRASSHSQLPVHTPAPVEPVATASAPVVKTLKEPPEIWDLVHEEPRSFNARAAFLARLRSVNRWVAVCVLTGVLLIVAGGVGVLVMKGSGAGSVQVEAPPSVTDEQAIPVQGADSLPVKTVVPAVREPAADASEAQIETPATVVSEQPRRTAQRHYKPRPSDNQIIVQESFSPAEPIVPDVATPEFVKPKAIEGPARVRPNETLSPQVITPAQSTKPKAKVIQWP